MNDIAIIGAGISGLASAYWLTQAGCDVTVFEACSEPGGSIRTEKASGFLYEYGPNSLLDTSPLIRKLVDGIGKSDRLIEANASAKNRYILRDGRLNALPMSPPAFLKTPLFSLQAKLRLLREPFIGKSSREESLAEFVQRRLGQEFLDYAIDPFVAGVFAGKPDQLSVQAAFGKLYALERDYGSLIRGTIRGARKRKKSGETSKQSARMLSFVDGLGELIDGLVAFLGDRVKLGHEITHIRSETDGITLQTNHDTSVRASRILITAPAQHASELLAEIAPSLVALLKGIYYPPVSIVYFGYQALDYPLDGFGYLVPSKEQRRILGTLWSSAIFPGRAPDGGAGLTTFIGGSRQPELALQEPEALVQMVREELQSIMGIGQEPDFVWVKQWTHAIPQYNLGHLQIVEAIEQFEVECPRIRIGGNFRGGISVSDCVQQAHRTAEALG